MLYILFIFFALSVVVERKIRNHIKNNYPKEWSKANQGKMGVKSSQTRPIILIDSLRHGYLSQQNDITMKRLVRIQKYVMVIFVIMIIIKLLFTST